jgi:carbon-monoxide dehydrogenase medium subunit
MFAKEFEYHRATSVDQAVQLLNANQDAKLLAGGHSLIPLMKLRQATPAAVVDIGGIDELRGITVSDGVIRIGALTTHRAIETSSEVQEACGMMVEVAGGIGDPQVRNRGTIGGNVSHADPGSDWPTVLTALNASFVIQGPAQGGSRRVPAAEFFTGLLTTVLAENEILTAVEVPRLGANQHAEYAKMAHPASFYAVVGGAVVVTMDGNRCTAASVAVGGLTPRPVKAPSVEQSLSGTTLTADSIGDATARLSDDLAAAGVDIIGDVYASAEFRSGVAPVEVKHALLHAIGLAHH